MFWIRQFIERVNDLRINENIIQFPSSEKPLNSVTAESTDHRKTDTNILDVSESPHSLIKDHHHHTRETNKVMMKQCNERAKKRNHKTALEVSSVASLDSDHRDSSSVYTNKRQKLNEPIHFGDHRFPYPINMKDKQNESVNGKRLTFNNGDDALEEHSNNNRHKSLNERFRSGFRTVMDMITKFGKKTNNEIIDQRLDANDSNGPIPTVSSVDDARDHCLNNQLPLPLPLSNSMQRNSLNESKNDRKYSPIHSSQSSSSSSQLMGNFMTKMMSSNDSSVKSAESAATGNNDSVASQSGSVAPHNDSIALSQLSVKQKSSGPVKSFFKPIKNAYNNIMRNNSSFRIHEKIQYQELLNHHLTTQSQSQRNTSKRVLYNNRRVSPIVINDSFTEDKSIYSYGSGSITEKLDSKESKSLYEQIKNAGIRPSITSSPYLQSHAKPQVSEDLNTDVEILPPLFENLQMPDSSNTFKHLSQEKSGFFHNELTSTLRQSVLTENKSQENRIKEFEERHKFTKEKREENEKSSSSLRQHIPQRELLSYFPYIKHEYEDETEEIEITDEEHDDISVYFPQLTPEMDMLIDDALRSAPAEELLCEKFDITIKRRDMETLSGLNWLNDQRSKNDNFPSVYSFNTFFYGKLRDGGHASLKRWTRKVDIFAHEFIFIPVHLGVHWCLSVIDFKRKRIQYYDSMGGKNDECLQSLLKYLKDESLDKKKKTFDTTDWILENIKDNPQQMNGSDCGMFACKYAEFISRRAKIIFTQAHMPYFRRRMVYEIKTQRLL